MYGFEIINFRAEHIKLEELRAHERDFLLSLGPIANAKLKLTEESGPGWTVLKDGQFVAAAGAIHYFGVTAEVWQFPGLLVPKFVHSYAKVFRAFTDELSEQYARLQTICLDDETHNRWMAFLDFKKEGVHPRYGFDEKQYATFARVN